MSDLKTPKHFDVVIAGASFAGLALARALADESRGSLRIALVERRDGTQDQPLEDARAFALSASSRYLLERLGVWVQIADDAQPVTTIEITDSSLDSGIRRVLLSWENRIPNGDPASYIVPAPRLHAALTKAAMDDAAITILQPAEIVSSKTVGSSQQVVLQDGRTLHATLVVAADGQKSPLRSMHDLKTVRQTYDQIGIVTTIAHQKPHNSTAVQHFLPGGPFAILPLMGNRSCITWSETAAEASRILDGEDALFLSELDTRLGGRLGAIEVVGPRQSWPLSMHLAHSYIAERFALIGDAAHTVHPIAGQGLNLGFRDVAALVDVVMDGASLGLDIGRLDVLERYERWRRSDSAF
ncbi:MAG: FAD-dependent monooxygenase, partial [Alphaproteobacteria bacterium]|nr:FAD-dependent monooxygenase [Alphaproteobacteria bacterium]